MALSVPIDIPHVFYDVLFKQGYDHRAVYGGRGSAKSHSFATLAILKAMERRRRILCCREIQSSIKESVKYLLERKIEAMNLRQFFRFTDTYIHCRSNGSVFIFEGLRYNAERLKSLEAVSYAWVSEAHKVSRQSIDVLMPTIREPGSEIWWDWNPQQPTDPVDLLFRGPKGPPPRSIVQRVHWSDNPWFPEFLQRQREWYLRTDPQREAHIYGGGYLQQTDAQVFKAGKHWRVGELDEFKPGPTERFYYGADWGFANDPTTLVRCYIQGKKLFVDHEAYGIGVEIDETPQLFDLVPGAREWPITADSARPETISYMQRNGYPKIRRAKKGKDSVKEGITFLQNFEIVVHPRCTHVQDELTHYSYKVDEHDLDPQTNQPKVLPILRDNKNHCIAEGQRVETARGLIPIEDVIVGDFVMTRKGYRRVVFSGETGRDRDTVCVKTTHGSVVCTPDHEFFTDRGLIRADALRYDDELWISQGWSRLSSTTVRNIGDIQRVIVVRTKFIFGIGSIFTGLFGKSTMGRFLKAFIFITRTAIQGTTRSRIWNACRLKNIRPGIHTMKRDSDDYGSILTELGLLRKLGIGVKRAVRNINRLVLSLIKTSFRPPSGVSPVVVFSSPTPSATEIVFAPTSANLHGGVNHGLMMKSEHVKNAEKGFQSIDTAKPRLVRGRVRTVSGIEKRRNVYDLTVEDQHEFFCEGILVSNCVDPLRYALEGKMRHVGMQVWTM